MSQFISIHCRNGVFLFWENFLGGYFTSCHIILNTSTLLDKREQASLIFSVFMTSHLKVLNVKEAKFQRAGEIAEEWRIAH